jgi:CheY-like chemotaxis protein
MAHILLVEDNASDAALIARVLRRAGTHLVHRVRDGVEALDYLGTEVTADALLRPTFVLLDLKLPRVDGLEVLRHMKAVEATCSIPVIVLTSSREPSDVSECYRLGVNSYVVKPVTYEPFAEVVERVARYWSEVNVWA